MNITTRIQQFKYNKNAFVQNTIILQLPFFYLSLVCVLMKMSSYTPVLSVKFLFLFSICVLLMVLYAFIWQQVLKYFPLLVAYSNKAIGSMWTLIWAMVFFDENVSIANIIGLIIITYGISLIYGSIRISQTN